MKSRMALMTLILGGCTTGLVPWAQPPQANEAACTASCDAHFEKCPQVFANFPERGAVECPAEHDNCLRHCASARYPTASTPHTAPPAAAPIIAPPAASSAPSTPLPPSNPTPAVSSKEAQLRELKHLHDEGLVSEDVYRERQRAILSEP